MPGSTDGIIDIMITTQITFAETATNRIKGHCVCRKRTAPAALFLSPLTPRGIVGVRKFVLYFPNVSGAHSL